MIVELYNDFAGFYVDMGNYQVVYEYQVEYDCIKEVYLEVLDYWQQ